MTITSKDGTATTATMGVNANCWATIGASGKLSFSVSDLSFATTDRFVIAALSAWNADIPGKVNGLLSAICIPLGPVSGVTFAGYAVSVTEGSAYAAGGLVAPVTSGFSITLGEPLVQQAVANLWWNNVQKHYSASGADVSLNSYTAAVSNGNVVLTLYLGGNYDSAGAEWDISIDPVTVSLPLQVGANCNIKIGCGTVSRPNVSLDPSNWLAYAYSIAGGIVATIITSTLNDVISGDRGLARPPLGMSGTKSELPFRPCYRRGRSWRRSDIIPRRGPAGRCAPR